jgi:tripartite ATP-independent transporter DctP family solute receptor
LGGLIFDRTGGELSIGIVLPGAQGSEKYALQQLRNGTIDMARVNVSAFENILPSAMIPALPFLFNSTAHMRRVLDGPIGDEILGDLERAGYIGLAFYDNGPRSFFTAGEPIRSAADLKGKRVRAEQADLWTAMMRLLGATAIAVPYSQSYAALRTGLVDVGENTLVSYESNRDSETAKYYSPTEHSMAPGVLVFSKKVWDRLSQRDRSIIRTAAKQSATYSHQVWDEREASVRKALQDAGAQIVTDVDRKSFADALAPAYAAFEADPKLLDLIQRIRAAGR